MTAAAPTPRTLRILMAKPGLDGHDRGVEVIAATAVQEDVDAVGLSIMSGAHNTLCPAVIAELEKRDAGDIAVFVGGIIPDADFDRLRAAGVTGIFTPGTPLDAIIEWVRDNVRRKA